MNREIKFRAWDEDIQEMMHPVDISKPIHYYEWLGTKDLPLMQFTGLLDKNGKEIYEGDCIGHIHNVVEWSKCGWCVAGDRPLWMFKNKEVIGNIYESKELLG